MVVHGHQSLLPLGKVQQLRAAPLPLPLLQIGLDPAAVESEPTPRYRYNYDYARYGGDAALMQQIRGAADIEQLQARARGPAGRVLGEVGRAGTLCAAGMGWVG